MMTKDELIKEKSEMIKKSLIDFIVFIQENEKTNPINKLFRRNVNSSVVLDEAKPLIDNVNDLIKITEKD